MKLLANENIPLQSVQIIDNSGFDIKLIGKELAGITDESIIKYANEEKRTIITFDSDYGELIFKKGFKPQYGVIYLRWKKYIPTEPGVYLIKLLNDTKIDFNRKLTVIDESHTIRQRVF